MRRRTIAGLVTAATVGALVVGISVVWPGLDAQETPAVDTSVWALQTGEGRRYARVNTTVAELDTVRGVSNPDEIVQTSDGVFLFSDSYSTLTRIDEAMPADLDDEALRESASTPPGTTEVVTAGDFVAYLTDSGAVHAGRLSDASAAQVDPFDAADDAPQYSADAIAVDRRGILFAYSRADASVVRYDISRSELRGRDPLTAEGIAAPAISAAGDEWVVVDTENGDVWRAGDDAPDSAPSTGAVVVGGADPDADAVYLADEIGLIRVPVDGSEITQAFGAGTAVLGTPAAPAVVDGEVYGAWVGEGDAGGVLWSARGGRVPLDYGEGTLGEQRRPVFVVGEDAAILNETRAGWAWSVPDGALVVSSQNWTLDERVDPDTVPSEEQLPVQLEPKPPIAEPDAFGVRPGTLSSLPVLLNDHDPNEDVLGVVPASIEGLDPAFGTVSVTDDGQRLAVRIEPGASGRATFSYAVADGTAEGGLMSAPTTVTLDVAAPGDDTAPQWCGVEGCLVEWPEPEVSPGGTVTVPVLPGWVDPEGDALLLSSVTNLSGKGSVAASPAGEVVYQHSDDGAGGESLIELAVTVADTRSTTTTRSLIVRVSPQPRIDVHSFALIDVLGAGIAVDVEPHVTGTTGMLSLESVRVLDDAAASATIVDGTTSFDFAPREPGTYRVDFTVTDDVSSATGTARITVLPADAPAQLATAPVVAFVHPQEDATLDVFAAVTNPTRRVLLLSEVVPQADPGATLSVDAVGQNFLRVSGTTADGAPGRLGTVRYTVSDGTEDEGSAVQGEAVVYLLPPAPELAPIAVDDVVVVRAGAQVDIPVLDNDISPSGGKPTLNPAAVVSSSPDALAFGSGELVRYLAPTTPGEYSVDYAVYTTGAPTLADTATVRIRVLGDEANRPPAPDTLEGRVLSGESTTIEFDPFGMDPDGDVVLLDRVVAQPERGSATVSADGRSIVYSSVPGDSGQVSFTYRVVDASGATGEGSVRIGVLDGQSNPSPVTYTDYVQVQVGEQSTIRVSPADNDVDPTGGELSITSVRPDVPATLMDGSANPEFERLQDRLRAVDDTTVVIAAGDEPGTTSYLYDVESSSGNAGRGLIVVRAVRERVPDYPVVADTILTVENRDEFATGVDVLAGKAVWSGGDVDDLSVTLWGDPADVEVDRGEIRGRLPDTTRLIPFAVTGEGASGEVTTYAFLRVPGEDDLTLALRSGARAPEVRELESVSFDVAELVAHPRGARLEVGDTVTSSGARAEGVCVREAGTAVRYDAGAGGPWADACIVPVRIAGDVDWTPVSVPILVQALDPQPELRAGSTTAGPGETITFDLRDMTTWQLREDWEGIEYAVSYDGTAFEVSQDGPVVSVTGRDRAVPGTEEAAIVSVTSHGQVAPVRLLLRVGAAPSTLPQGGSVVMQCTQSAGSSCSATVVGAGGEINPLPRTPLEVVEVRTTGACVGVTFSVVSATAVEASWDRDAPGSTCSATFSVADAQGRRTNAERDGTILLDLLGYPKAPASIAQTAYADGEVTLRVDPGEARLAYPALAGFIVRSDGAEVARCDAAGACPAISAPNGEQRTYEAVAINEVGESLASVRTIAWAYDAPAAPTAVTVRPVVTDGEGGVVSLRIEGLEPAETREVEISSPSGERITVPVRRNETTLEVSSYRVGTNTSSPITVTPYSRFELPPGLGGTVSGAAVTVSGNGIGAPRDPDLVLSSSSNGDGTSTITARASAQSGGDGSTLHYGIVDQGTSCTATAGGNSATFVKPDGLDYSFTLCVESVWEDESFGRVSVTASVKAQQSRDAPRGYTFVVDGAPDVSPSRAEWRVRAEPTSPERVPNRNRVEFNGFPSTVFGRDPGILVRYVHEWWGTTTDWGRVAPAPGSAPYPVQATWSVTSCVGGGSLVASGSSSTAPSGAGAAISFSNADVRYYDQSGALLPHEAGTWAIPAEAAYVEGIGVTVDWSALGWGLQSASTSFAASCTPAEPPAEEPVP